MKTAIHCGAKFSRITLIILTLIFLVSARAYSRTLKNSGFTAEKKRRIGFCHAFQK